MFTPQGLAGCQHARKDGVTDLCRISQRAGRLARQFDFLQHQTVQSGCFAGQQRAGSDQCLCVYPDFHWHQYAGCAGASRFGPASSKNTESGTARRQPPPRRAAPIGHTASARSAPLAGIKRVPWTTVIRPARGGSAAGQSHVAASASPGESSPQATTSSTPATNAPAVVAIQVEVLMWCPGCLDSRFANESMAAGEGWVRTLTTR